MDLVSVPGHLKQLVADAVTRFDTVSTGRWETPRSPGKWSRKEVLGHLVDSAVNNHQRFVRALIEPELHWPGYRQEEHVAVQNYAAEEPATLIALWSALNRHIAHVVAQIPPEKAETLCFIADDPSLPLTELVVQYVAHLEHHLRQILDEPERVVTYSGMPWPPVERCN